MFLNISRLFYAAILAGLLFTPVFGNEHCGTTRFIEKLKNPVKKFSAASTGCVPKNYYGKVDTAITENFIIFYTKERPDIYAHAIKTTEYIDSLKSYLEQAYELYRDSLGLDTILGTNRTYHYQENVPFKPKSGKRYYPVEVIDIGLMRNYEGEDYDVLGMVFSPYTSRPKETQIAIENDFLYGADCSGKLSEKRIISRQNVDYSIQWRIALKTIAFHELYHSFQFAIYDMINNPDSFWYEAAASGVEEIGVPEFDNYINHLYKAFQNPGQSMINGTGYEHATLYLFLFSELGSKFDSYILDYFSKYPKENFAYQLAMLANNLGIDSEDLFHRYAQKVFFSGSRAAWVPQDSLLWPQDQDSWPLWRISIDRVTSPRILPSIAIDFVRTSSSNVPPNVDSVARKSFLEDSNSYIWVLSRLLEAEFIPPEPPEPPKPSGIHWNLLKPDVKLTFGILPENSKGMEIRSANGTLIKKIEGSPGEEIIWPFENPPKSGIYFYRILPNGKARKLIVTS